MCGAGDDQQVAGQHAGAGRGVLEVLIGAFQADNRDPMAFTNAGLGQGAVVGQLRRVDLGDGERYRQAAEPESGSAATRESLEGRGARAATQ